MRLPRSPSDARKTLVGFVLGDAHYAVDIARVVQILRPLPLTPLPPSPESVVGITEYRGDVVPVIDLRLRFGLPERPSSARSKWILLTLSGQPLMIVVDDLTGVFGTATHALRPAPGLAGDATRGVLGITSYEGRLTFVIDVNQLRTVVASLPPPSSRGSRPLTGASPSTFGSKR